MIPPVLVEIALQFGILSLLSIGGANAVIPEIQLRAVEIEHWMSNADFAQMFALSQASPGPNVLIVSLVGWKAAGIPGAIVALLAMSGPSSMLTFAVAHAWERFREAPWRAAIQRGLAPVTVGLIVASGYILTRAADHDWRAYVLTIVTAIVATATRLHPLSLLGLAAVLGALDMV